MYPKELHETAGSCPLSPPLQGGVGGGNRTRLHAQTEIVLRTSCNTEQTLGLWVSSRMKTPLNPPSKGGEKENQAQQ
jgi:hypothetical protein